MRVEAETHSVVGWLGNVLVCKWLCTEEEEEGRFEVVFISEEFGIVEVAA